jgi:hypothetical protein
MVYMDPLQEEIIKHREIHFQPDLSDTEVANNAVTLLTGANGILEVRAINCHCIAVTYDIRLITLQVIEEALQEVGLMLDNSLFHKMRRAMVYYMEETQLVNMGCSQDQAKSTLGVFISRYQQRAHGCRDERPDYYHHYH